MTKELRGSGVALVTPFDKENKVDFNSLERIVNNCIKGGIKNLIVLGTTAETPTLTNEEKQEILTFVSEKATDNVNLVAGFGGNSTAQVVSDINSFDLTGYKYILSASPYYNKPSQEGIFQHYKSIASDTDLPIILYNVPGRTSSNIEATTTLKLAREFDKIVAIKEASGDLNQCMNIANNKPEDFAVLSGDDNLVCSQLAIGMDGCISVIANLIPKEFNDLIESGLNGDFEKCREIQLKYLEMISLIFKEGNPVGIKSALSLSNLSTDIVRLPLVSASSSLREEIKKQLIKI